MQKQARWFRKRETFVLIIFWSLSVSLTWGCGSSGSDSSLSSMKELEALCERLLQCIPELEEQFSSEGVSCPEVLYVFERGARVDRSTDTKVIRAVLNCIKKASDCNAMKACGKATTEQAKVCPDTGWIRRCAGDILVECDGSAQPDAFDCAAAGLHCYQSRYDANCGEASCNPETTKAVCDGDVIKSCYEGALVLEDCRWRYTFSCESGQGCVWHAGGTCAVNSYGEADCVGTGPACDEKTFKAYCDGPVIVTCAGGKEARLDCSAIDSALTCKKVTKDNMELLDCGLSGS